MYNQETEFLLLEGILPYIDKSFIDVGAEKGSFAQWLVARGFTGVVCEPLPHHGETLQTLAASSPVKFLPFAIDATDGERDFHIATDDQGLPLDYFHSLQPLSGDARVHHTTSVRVRCRSLSSLSIEGLVPPSPGLLKIDTEGHDLHVLRGMGEMFPAAIMTEFFTDGLYQGWTDAHPDRLVEQARQMGYSHFIAVSRHVNGGERVEYCPLAIAPGEWGNLIFLRDDVFALARAGLVRWIVQPPPVTPSPRGHSQEAAPPGELEAWLRASLPSLAPASGLLDIGAYQGDFTAAMLAGGVSDRAWLFEPNPESYARLEARFVQNDAVKTAPLAVGAQTERRQLKRVGHPSTASLLDYTSAEKAEAIQVACTTLDEWWQLNARPAIGLIKIDTQGNDLAVLEGAGQLLARERPALVVELIFSTLYVGQSTPAAILDWALRHNYRLAGIFNEHYSAAGLLAFADAAFIPAERSRPDSSEYQARPSVTALSRQVEELTRVCEERLALINSLHHEAAKRLEIINQLQRTPAS